MSRESNKLRTLNIAHTQPNPLAGALLERGLRRGPAAGVGAGPARGGALPHALHRLPARLRGAREADHHARARGGRVRAADRGLRARVRPHDALPGPGSAPGDRVPSPVRRVRPHVPRPGEAD